MKKYYNLLIILSFTFLASNLHAQPFDLKSIGEKKEFQLTIYFDGNGKGAFVRYKNHNAIIPLSLKSITADSSEVEYGQPSFKTYTWNEIVDGKVNGIYKLTEWPRNIADISYTRKKDNRIFNLALNDKDKYDGSDKYFLNNILISFNHFFYDQLSFKFQDNTVQKINLPALGSGDAVRRAYIKDYNFDGYDDISFTVSNNGTITSYIAFLYNPKFKKYNQLIEPNYKNSKCKSPCEMNIDSKLNMLYTTCIVDSAVWRDYYHFENEKLIWFKSTQEHTNF